MNDKRSYTEYTVTTATTDFVIGFDDYDDGTKDTIVVTVNGVLAESQGYAVMRKNAQVITITPAVQSGTVRLERVTDIDESFHQFTAGALFSAKSVDENFEQVRHSQQEVRDGFEFLEYNTNGVISDAKAATDRANAAAELAENTDISQFQVQLDEQGDLITAQGLSLEAQKLDTGITVTAKNGGVERELSNKLTDILTINDFGIIGDGVTNETDKLAAIANVVDVVDLLGKTVFSSVVPAGRFVNGVIKTASAEYNYSLVAPKKNGVRVATWNIWSGGSSTTNFGGDRYNPERFSQLKSKLLQYGFDIVGLQETHHNTAVLPVTQYKVHPLVSAVASVSMTYKNGDKYGNITMATQPTTASKSVVFASPPSSSDSEFRSYVNTRYLYNGKTVSVYNTHFSLDTVRIESMAAELCNAVIGDSASVVFVMGDFNTNNWSLFSPLISAGFSQVNNNTIDTNPSGATWFIDDIFYKGASINGAPAVYIDTVLADHSALYADFNI